MSEQQCLFCKIIAGEIPGEIVDSDEGTLAFLDINPATRGHSLVVPKAHFEDLYEIPAGELEAAAMAAQRLALRLRDVLGCDGVNTINSCGAAAWQTVGHFHIHVIPRYEGDPLRLPWVPKPAETEELREVAHLLTA